jgi:hypothetical protein
MEKDVDYSNLRFEQQRRFVPGKVFLVGTILAAFNLLWWFVPQNTLYWVLLITLAILSWLASYGWRNALIAIHNLIHLLEQFSR